MILVSSCRCLCPIHWRWVLSREWRCRWSSADRRCSNYIWVILNLIAYWGAILYYRFDDIPASVQIMAWRHPGDKLLSEPMMVSLLTHICITRPQWVKQLQSNSVIQTWGPFCWHGLTLIPTRICNHMSSKVWWKWMNNFIPHSTVDVITYPYWD